MCCCCSSFQWIFTVFIIQSQYKEVTPFPQYNCKGEYVCNCQDTLLQLHTYVVNQVHSNSLFWWRWLMHINPSYTSSWPKPGINFNYCLTSFSNLVLGWVDGICLLHSYMALRANYMAICYTCFISLNHFLWCLYTFLTVCK